MRKGSTRVLRTIPRALRTKRLKRGKNDMSKKKPTALGAHIYAGGFSLGVRRHFDVLCHFEEWKFGVATVEQNLKIPVHVGEPSTWPINEYTGYVDFVYCNPPCAPWSRAGGKA